MTIAAALAEAQQAIGRLEARVLLRHVLRCDEAFLIAHGEDELTATQSADFGRLISRRAAGINSDFLSARALLNEAPVRVLPHDMHAR